MEPSTLLLCFLPLLEGEAGGQWKQRLSEERNVTEDDDGGEGRIRKTDFQAIFAFH